jgi:hypothetical protein
MLVPDHPENKKTLREGGSGPLRDMLALIRLAKAQIPVLPGWRAGTNDESEPERWRIS